jgi:hypothetical protein
MNDLSSVNSVPSPVDNSVSQAPIYAAIACAIIYASLCVVLAPIGGLIERVLIGGLGGCLFWIVIWIIGAFLIEKAGRRTARVIATGSVYGAIVGLASGYILASWPYCSYPTDLAPQTLIMGIGAPAILFHAISFGRLSEGNDPVLGLLSSATFWAMFGLTLAMLYRWRRQSASR